MRAAALCLERVHEVNGLTSHVRRLRSGQQTWGGSSASLIRPRDVTPLPKLPSGPLQVHGVPDYPVRLDGNWKVPHSEYSRQRDLWHRQSHSHHEVLLPHPDGPAPLQASVTEQKESQKAQVLRRSNKSEAASSPAGRSAHLCACLSHAARSWCQRNGDSPGHRLMTADPGLESRNPRCTGGGGGKPLVTPLHRWGQGSLQLPLSLAVTQGTSVPHAQHARPAGREVGTQLDALQGHC